MNKRGEYNIGKNIELGDGSVVVLLDMLGGKATIPQVDMEQNVYRLDHKGDVVWRVSGGAPVYPRTPFTGIWIDESKKLMGYRWDGGQFEIDLETGEARPVKLAR